MNSRSITAEEFLTAMFWTELIKNITTFLLLCFLQSKNLDLYAILLSSSNKRVDPSSINAEVILFRLESTS